MNSSLRIAIVTPVYPPYRGGIGTVADHDAACLRALGHRVEVFTPSHKTPSPIESGITRLQPFYAWGNGAVLFDLLTKLREFDVIHLHYPFFGSDILAAFAAKFWNIPLVLTYHMRPKASGILGFTFRAYRFMLERFVFQSAKVLLASSSEYAKENGVRHRRVEVLPFGINTERFVPGNRALARKAFGLSDNVPTVLFVGGLDRAHYFKGVDVLLAACSALKTPWQLLIVGDGNNRKTFESFAGDLGVSDRVHFAGSVPFADLPRAYQAADVHVLPSIDRSEAFGLVTLEAMACGVPSIVSDLPGVRSLIVSNETGVLVPPGDSAALTIALEQYCGDENFAKHCGERARIRACALYDERILADQLVRVYNSIIV